MPEGGRLGIILLSVASTLSLAGASICESFSSSAPGGATKVQPEISPPSSLPAGEKASEVLVSPKREYRMPTGAVLSAVNAISTATKTLCFPIAF